MRRELGERGIAPFTLEDMTAWWDGCGDIRDTGRRLLGGAGGRRGGGAGRCPSCGHAPPAEVVCGRCWAGLRPCRLGTGAMSSRRSRTGSRRSPSNRTRWSFISTNTTMLRPLRRNWRVWRRCRKRPGRGSRVWLARDREWREELASIARLTGAQGQQADPAARREAAGRPAVAGAIRRETGRLARLPEPERFVPWTGEEPLVPGDRVRIGSGGDPMEAVVVSAGEAGGTRPDDRLELRMLLPAGPDSPPDRGPQLWRSPRQMTPVGCERAVWPDEGLRELELARQQSVPSGVCRLACPEPVPGDRIAWTEDAGYEGRVRTVEAKVAARVDDILYGSAKLRLEVLGASGPSAPDPGSSIERSTKAVTARGCFRADWADEAQRERILNPPRPVQAPRQAQEQTQEQRIDRSEGGGISA